MTYQTHVASLTACPDQATSTLETIIQFAHSTPIPLDQSLIDALLSVFGNSNFLSRWAHRYPEYVLEILNSEYQLNYDTAAYIQALQNILTTHPPQTQEELLNILLDFKYRHLFRITLKDIGFQKAFTEVSSEISALALAILQTSLTWHLEQLQQELGIPVTEDTRTPIPFSILAMGKLGGHELNYSSDLDLIYFYGSDQGQSTSKKSSSISPHQYFTKLGERLTHFLSRKTSEGFLYRIDLELRPEGNGGVLVNSLSAMEYYYESFGASWERQAMIKANIAAGDVGLFKDFQKMIRPFIYTQSVDFSFLQDIKKMKDKILDTIKGSGTQAFNVKLGEGGIREIEFFTQALQLLFGGTHPSLRTTNTIDALTKLEEVQLIQPSERHALQEAYIYLRTLEHRLQMVEEQQTHLMPHSAEELKLLARRMCYRSKNINEAVDNMQNDLEKHRIVVQDSFNKLFLKGS